ncbi:MAG TPA: hypothetical protein PKE63_01185 [Lacibacter sp.]|nr:hypothetical protein [Lacibacter sp.]HMO90126.1 hypothetical protein [Lacibacter sp.]HMP85855.1 hypothetical protein [Lacibacter sp.]
MNTFTDFENLWQQQSRPAAQRPAPEEVVQRAEQQAVQLKKKFRWTMGILLLTVVIIAGYFFQYAGFRFTAFSAGLLLMIGSLLLRIVLEWISAREFRRLDVRADFTTYLQRLTAFYKKRRTLHGLITPLLYAVYTTGFVLLLPVFRQEFSTGFYYYLLASGFGSLVVLGWVILKANRRELSILAELKKTPTGAD